MGKCSVEVALLATDLGVPEKWKVDEAGSIPLT